LPPYEGGATYPVRHTYDVFGNKMTMTTFRDASVGRGAPTAPEEEFVPQFDDDGNQTLVKTSTGIWSVDYNGENRPNQWSNGATNITIEIRPHGPPRRIS